MSKPIPGQELIDAKLTEQGLSRSDLARQLGISRQVVTRTLNSTALINERAEHWPAILDALGLEVVIRPKRQPETVASEQ
jgi:transcriptional regulator with XRE-family HTH domain